MGPVIRIHVCISFSSMHVMWCVVCNPPSHITASPKAHEVPRRDEEIKYERRIQVHQIIRKLQENLVRLGCSSSMDMYQTGWCSINALDLYSWGVGLNLDQNMGYLSWVFLWFFSDPPGRCQDSTWTSPTADFFLILSKLSVIVP
jgi:hypothetical protein